MYSIVCGDEVDLFTDPSRLILAGCSGSGKTQLLTRLIKKYSHKFDKIISIGSDLPAIDGVKITRDDSFDPFDGDEFSKYSKHCLTIYDDILGAGKQHLLNCSKLFIQGRHGNNKTQSFSTVVVVQNLFCAEKGFRNLSLNATHIFLFKNRDMRQIRIFANSFLSKGNASKFIDLYNAVLNTKYSYLLIDFTKNVADILLLRGSVAGEGRELVYKL